MQQGEFNEAKQSYIYALKASDCNVRLQFGKSHPKEPKKNWFNPPCSINNHTWRA